MHSHIKVLEFFLYVSMVDNSKLYTLINDTDCLPTFVVFL